VKEQGSSHHDPAGPGPFGSAHESTEEIDSAGTSSRRTGGDSTRREAEAQAVEGRRRQGRRSQAAGPAIKQENQREDVSGKVSDDPGIQVSRCT
jgi:hypothetical protein